MSTRRAPYASPPEAPPEAAAGPARLRNPSDRSDRSLCRLGFDKIAWLVTVAAALITALLLFLFGYNGYGAVAVAIGLSAAVNLF